MIIQEIPPAEWRSFFDGFSRTHRGWLATVQGMEREMPVTRVRSAAIRSVTLEPGVPGQMVRLTFVNGISLCAPRPCAVRVQQTDAGTETALEIDAVEGVFIRVAFRASPRQEELDGLAPTEVMFEGPGVLRP